MAPMVKLKSDPIRYAIYTVRRSPLALVGIIMILTVITIRSSSAWVYYSGELKGKR